MQSKLRAHAESRPDAHGPTAASGVVAPGIATSCRGGSCKGVRNVFFGGSICDGCVMAQMASHDNRNQPTLNAVSGALSSNGNAASNGDASSNGDAASNGNTASNGDAVVAPGDAVVAPGDAVVAPGDAALNGDASSNGNAAGDATEALF